MQPPETEPTTSAVFAQRHDRADRPRRRTPGAHHGGQQRALAGQAPVAQGAQHHHIKVFHTRSSYSNSARYALWRHHQMMASSKTSTATHTHTGIFTPFSPLVPVVAAVPAMAAASSISALAA